jgi:hypothetical protein
LSNLPIDILGRIAIALITSFSITRIQNPASISKEAVMHKTTAVNFLITFILVLSLFSACKSDGQKNSASAAVEKYLQALVERDFNKIVNVSCAAWESQAKVEFDSFAAVKLELRDLACKENGQVDGYTLIACEGSIIANYGAEDLEINIADRIYQTIQEGGEWRMCGYK